MYTTFTYDDADGYDPLTVRDGVTRYKTYHRPSFRPIYDTTGRASLVRTSYPVRTISNFQNGYGGYTPKSVLHPTSYDDSNVYGRNVSYSSTPSCYQNYSTVARNYSVVTNLSMRHMERQVIQVPAPHIRIITLRIQIHIRIITHHIQIHIRIITLHHIQIHIRIAIQQHIRILINTQIQPHLDTLPHHHIQLTSNLRCLIQQHIQMITPTHPRIQTISQQHILLILRRHTHPLTHIEMHQDTLLRIITLLHTHMDLHIRTQQHIARRTPNIPRLTNLIIPTHLHTQTDTATDILKHHIQFFHDLKTSNSLQSREQEALIIMIMKQSILRIQKRFTLTQPTMTTMTILIKS